MWVIFAWTDGVVVVGTGEIGGGMGGGGGVIPTEGGRSVLVRGWKNRASGLGERGCSRNELADNKFACIIFYYDFIFTPRSDKELCQTLRD